MNALLPCYSPYVLGEKGIKKKISRDVATSYLLYSSKILPAISNLEFFGNFLHSYPSIIGERRRSIPFTFDHSINVFRSYVPFDFDVKKKIKLHRCHNELA